MMRFVELVLLRLLLWGGLPLLLVVLAIGPGRVWKGVKRAWNWLWQRRLDPEEILAQVVRQHKDHVQSLQHALAQAETAEADILRNITRSEENLVALEKESGEAAQRNDDLGARASLYKLNLERLALNNFKEQLQKQRQLIEESRRRLYELDLQLRQYEVGRSILLSQLAEAKTAEQQYQIANQFDPFSAVANWQKAEGLVEEKAASARAAERVHKDIAELEALGSEVDPAVLEAQLAELKAKLQHPIPIEHVAPEENGEHPRGRQTETNS